VVADEEDVILNLLKQYQNDVKEPRRPIQVADAACIGSCTSAFGLTLPCMQSALEQCASLDGHLLIPHSSALLRQHTTEGKARLCHAHTRTINRPTSACVYASHLRADRGRLGMALFLPGRRSVRSNLSLWDWAAGQAGGSLLIPSDLPFRWLPPNQPL
jgi:hypothetical protein